MVLCTVCTVNRMDQLCGNAARACFYCCTTRDDIDTCPYHFSIMGNTQRAARLLSGKVHPHILADAADEEIKADDDDNDNTAAVPAPPNVLAAVATPPPGPQRDVVAPAAAAAHAVPNAPIILAPAAAQPPPVYDTAALAASVHALTAMVQQLMQAEAARQAQAAAALALAPAAPAAPAPAVSLPSAVPLPFIPLPPPAAAAVPDAPALLSPPPPHRAAVLDRAAVSSHSDIAALVNRFSALPDSDDEDTTVPPQQHTRATHTPQPAAAGVLPDAFVPAPVGSEHTPAQQLAAIFNALHKQGGKVKYASIEELNEALDDWAAGFLKSGRSAQQVESVRTYQRLLVQRFAISDGMPLKQVLEYHRLWCKRVADGTIDMFAPGAALNHDIFHEATHPLRLIRQGSTSSPSSSKDGRSKSTADKAKKPTAKHPAGSCTNHPLSTTHTTAECLMKK